MLYNPELFVAFEKARAQDEFVDSSFSEADATNRYRYEQLKCFIDGDQAGMIDYFNKRRVIFETVKKLGLYPEAKRVLDGYYPYIREDIINNQKSPSFGIGKNSYREILRLAHERGEKVEEIIDTVFYEFLEIEYADYTLSSYWISKNEKLTVSPEEAREAFEQEDSEKLEELNRQANEEM